MKLPTFLSKSGRLAAKEGLAPGTLTFVGEKHVENVRVTAINYDEQTYEEVDEVNAKTLKEYVSDPKVNWINLNGIHDIALIESVGKAFNLHALTLEDVVNTTQRPKVEVYDHYIFVVLRMAVYREESNTIDFEQVSLVFGDNFVISFQEQSGDVFNAVRGRIKNSKGRIRKVRSDYLAYALMDAIVDHYFVVLEQVGEYMERIDDEIMDNPQPSCVQTIQQVKRNMLGFRKTVWPLREEISTLLRSEAELIEEATLLYLRDLYDHTIQVIDTVETYRDVLSGMHEMYLSNLGTRTNEIMRVLTIIATIFIPLTFIVGVYGMNFDNMPELHWEWSYTLVWIIMGIVTGGLVVFFKRKNWL